MVVSKDLILIGLNMHNASAPNLEPMMMMQEAEKLIIRNRTIIIIIIIP
jgi:hypothetical protein